MAVDLYKELEDRFGKQIAATFMEVVDNLKSAAAISRAIQAIHDGDLGGVLDALNLDKEEAYNRVLDDIEVAYRASGYLTADQLRVGEGAQLNFHFDARNPAAEDYLRSHSSQLVTRITSDQRQAVQEALAAGMERGDNPTTTALDIVGRIDRSTGKRSGGIIGLTSQQAQWVSNAKNELASGDQELLSNYLTRGARDRRFDGRVVKAIRGEPMSADDQTRAYTAYSNRLLKLRGDLLARTETLTALRTAKNEAYSQAVESGEVAPTDIKKIWRSAGDDRVRDTHQALDGESVVGMDGLFQSPSGARLLFPGDTSYGADASEIIACRCDVGYHIDFLGQFGPAPDDTPDPEDPENAAGVTFEVAPDPNNLEATAAWNQLSDSQKQVVSQKVAEGLMPWTLQAAGTSGRVVFHTGGYLGATNPSMTLTVDDPTKVEDVAKLLGHALSQDSMMVISPVQTPHTSPTGVIDINIGDADPATIYDRLWKGVTEDGKPIVSGHTTMNGRMSILNDSGLPDEELATRMSAALDHQYEMVMRKANLGFIGKDDYGFDEAAAEHQGRTALAAAEGSSLREAADRLRAQANQRIEDLVAQELGPTRKRPPH